MSTFEAALRGVLAFGGAMVAVANLYFDESGTHDGSKLMTVAGYWFESEQAVKFSRDWARDLTRLGLTYAHMTDCAHGCGEYKNLTLEQRILSEKLLIEHIKRRSRYGFAITVDPNKYKEIMNFDGAPSCYTMCLISLFHHISVFARVNEYKGKLAYFFEAGHKSANEANAYMNGVSANGQGWVEHTQYAGHAFVGKLSAAPLQAADMLAWQTRHYYERLAAGHSKPRKDFKALVRKFDLTAELNETGIISIRDFLTEVAPLVFAGDHSNAIMKSGEILNRHDLSIKLPPRFKR